MFLSSLTPPPTTITPIVIPFTVAVATTIGALRYRASCLRFLQCEMDDQAEVEESASIIRLVIQELEEAGTSKRGRVLIVGSRKGEVCRGLAERLGDAAMIVGLEFDPITSRQAQTITNNHPRACHLVTHVRTSTDDGNFLSIDLHDFVQGNTYDVAVLDQRRLPPNLTVKQVLAKVATYIKPGGLILSAGSNEGSFIEACHALALIDPRQERTVTRPPMSRCRVTVGPKLVDAARLKNAASSNIIIRVGCVVIDQDEKVLWISGRRHPDSYVLPAGRLEPGETKAQGARREVLEEAGVTGGDVQELGEVHNGESITTFFLLTNHVMLDTFEEAAWRRRRWLSITESRELGGCIAPASLDLVQRAILLYKETHHES